MNNLCIYELAREVPGEAKKLISAGRLKGMTDINPMYRIKKLTEIFGPCGIGWWYEITDKHFAADEITKQVAAFVDINLYYVDPETGVASKAIPGTGGASFVAQERNGPYMSDECYKMALTDAISVAAKALGIGADVYWDKDRSKYFEHTEQETPPDQRKDSADDYTFKCQECGETLKPYKDANGVDVSIRKHANGSLAKFGRCLCIDCIRKAQAAPSGEST